MEYDEDRREKGTEQPERKKRGAFGRGMTAGILVGLLAAGCLSLLWEMPERLMGILGLQDREASVSQGDLDREDKINLIESMIDQAFLYETDGEELEEYLYKGLMAGLNDPYSGYYTEEEFESLMEETQGVFCGIGVQAMQSYDTMEASIVQVYKGSPAEEAGVQKGDIIKEVDGENVESQNLDDIVSKIKGEEGTVVHIRFYRPETGAYLEMDLERRQVEVDTVTSHMLDDEIGYLKITNFDDVTKGQFEQAMGELESQGMEGLILDVRDNPGGLVDCVVEIADQLLPEGTIVYTEDKNGQGETYESDQERQFTKPLAVLINGSSASASEILAGAVKAYGTGTLVGTQTFGKGIVQNIIPLKDGSAVKMTVSRYFTPDGICIHGEGIAPDVEVELPAALQDEAEIPEEEDVQLQEALYVVREKMEQE